jgi:thymidylate synthase
MRGKGKLMYLFEANSADEAWCNAAAEFVSGRESTLHSGRDGDTHELLHATFCIHDPRQRWITSRRPQINPAFAIAEIVWILRGREDSAFLNFWNSQLHKFCGNGPKYDGAYGYRFREQFGTDQLERAYLALRGCPESRQVVMQIWDPKKDLPDALGRPASSDVPCNICSMLKIRNGRLEWTQILRSNDLFLGVPYNFVQFTSLQEVMAGWLGLELGDYVQFSDSLHVYQRDSSRLKMSVPKDQPSNTDQLGLSKPESDVCFADLEADMLALMGESLKPSDLMTIAKKRRPSGFTNMALVLSAFSARKRNWHPQVSELLSDCTNPALRTLCARWCASAALAG